jgi:hypothetical protein
VFAGLILGRFVEKIASNSALANDVKGGALAAKIANIAIILFACLLALEQININFDLINQIILIMLASAGLAFALAFGLGGKSVVENFLKEVFKK